MFENEVLINGIAIDWNDIKVVLNAREITPYRSTGKFPGDLNKHSIHLTLSDGEIKYLKMMNIHSNLIDSEEQWEYYYKRGTNCFFRSNGRKFLSIPVLFQCTANLGRPVHHARWLNNQFYQW